eukprot:gene10983-14753_t
MQNRLLSWNPSKSGQLISAIGNQADLLEIKTVDELHQPNINSKPFHNIKASKEFGAVVSNIEWCPFIRESSVTAFGSVGGNVDVINWTNSTEVNICDPSKLGVRCCNALAWNHSSIGRVAAGFDNIRSEHSCIIWDLHGSSFARILSSDSASSLAWLEDSAHVLAIGTSMGWVKLYDQRSSHTVPLLSYYAHPGRLPKKVKGIRVDPFCSYSFATFSDAVGDEAVKIWDIRKLNVMKTLNHVTPSFTVLPRCDEGIGAETGLLAGGHLSHSTPQPGIVDIAWSPTQEGILAVALLSNKSISFYCTKKNFDDQSKQTDDNTQPSSKAMSEISTHHPLHTFSVTTDTIKNLNWQNTSKTPGENYFNMCDCPASAGWEVFGTMKESKSLRKKELFDFMENNFSKFDEISHETNRIFVSTSNGYIDFEFKERIPMALSSFGIIALSSRNNIVIANTTSTSSNMRKPSTANDNFNQLNVEEIMKRRSQTGYSFDASNNLEVISMELDNMHIHSASVVATECVGEVWSHLAKSIHKRNCLELYRVWMWVDRIETTLNTKTNNLFLRNCGVLNRLSGDKIKSESGDSPSYVPILGCRVYNSKERILCKNMCGWTTCMYANRKTSFPPNVATVTFADDHENDLPNFDEAILDVIVDECEVNDGFERAAALALWHGSIDLAVRVLLNVAEGKRKINDDKETAIEWDYPVSQEYLKLVSLVAMCWAGFAGQLNLQHNSSWVNMCEHVLFLLQTVTRRSSAYLRAGCLFLLQISTSNSKFFALEEIITDKEIALEDRIAFGCTFMDYNPLINWLTETLNVGKSKGEIELLIISGLSSQGISVLQNYIDIYNDIQTAALLVSRNIESKVRKNSQDNEESSSQLSQLEWRWVNEYRNVLNRWELFIERASLDVELGKRHRHNSDLLAFFDDNNNRAASNVPNSIKPVSYGLGNQKNRSGAISANMDKSKMKISHGYAIPPHSDNPHVFLRCSYCGASLPLNEILLNKLDNAHNQKSVLNCCASCNKQLPRCYVCRLYLGMINPYLDFKSTQNQRRNNIDNFSGVLSGREKKDESVVHNVLDFTRWFYFCQHCRHGGHSVCIDEWFTGGSTRRDVCGVNGCGCNCMVWT